MPVGVERLLQAGVQEAVRRALLDDALVAAGRHQRVDLDAVGAGAHEARVGLG